MEHSDLDDVAEVWQKANPNDGLTVPYETYHLDTVRAEKALTSKDDILTKRFGMPMEHSDLDELIHYGVLGMKWGRRKDRKGRMTLEERAIAERERYELESSEDHIMSRKVRNKKVHELSNYEIEALNQRLKLEAEWKKYNPSPSDIRRQRADKVLATTQKIEKAYKFYNSDAGVMLTNMGLRYMGRPARPFKGDEKTEKAIDKAVRKQIEEHLSRLN